MNGVCATCGTATGNGWWWFCGQHRIIECDPCSIPHDDPDSGRSYSDGSHRFDCEAMRGPTFHRPIGLA